ncbi:MAG: hypothetical protein OXG27_15980 [Chloroflexi bacterium]|nr:hypothetical protein [Chloroflexota bacterium]
MTEQPKWRYDLWIQGVTAVRKESVLADEMSQQARSGWVTFKRGEEIIAQVRAEKLLLWKRETPAR